MKQKLRRIIPWLLALVLLCPAVQNLRITARAAEDLTVTIDTGEAVTLADSDGDGCYEIGTADELYAFAALVNGGSTAINGKLTANITVNEQVLTGDGELNGDGDRFRIWTPIGSISNSYRGTFDGQSHTVSGLYFYDTGASYVGLFGNVYTGTVQNVGLTDSCFVGRNDIGGIAGRNSGTVTNCHSAAKISGVDYVGGIAGRNYGTVTNCHSAAKISGANYVGGIAGINTAAITDCYNAGDVTGNEDVGGVVGSGNVGTLTNCYNTGNVTGETRVGGVAGYNPKTVSNCYNTGDVSGETEVGGVAGYVPGTLVNCYSAGAVTGDTNVGGVVGYGTDIVANSYFDSTKFSGDAIGTGSAWDDLTGGRTSEAFASGEVAYLLSQGCTVYLEVDYSEETGPVYADVFFSGDCWGQNIGIDDYPIFGGEKVCTYTNCAGTPVYSNRQKEDGSHSFSEDNICTVDGCGEVGAARVITKSINEVYETLEQAIAAVAACTAEDEARVVLAKNIPLENALPIGSGVFTLDLSGNTLSCDENNTLNITGSDTHVTLTGGTVVGGNGCYCVNVDGSTFTLSGGTLRANTENGHGICAASGSTVNISGGEILAEEFFGGTALEATGATVNITGGTLRGGQMALHATDSYALVTGGEFYSKGIHGIFATGSNCSVDIHDGMIDGNSFALSVYDGAAATVTGGTFNDGLLVQGGELTVSGGTVNASEADIQYTSGTLRLTLGETGEGATFPGGIWISGISLSEALGEGAAYWQEGRQIALTEYQTEIPGGDVTVKTACGHSGGTQTCMGYLCEICSLPYGEADPDAHLLNTNRDGSCGEDFLCSECEGVLRPARDHTPAAPIRENEVAATLKKEGSYEEVVYCSVASCQEEISRTEHSIPMLTKVEIPETEGGTVTVDKDTPAIGEEVTVTVTPDSGNEVAKVTVTDGSGKELPVTEHPDGTYSYKQPGGKVTVTVTYRSAECPKDETCVLSQFADIKVDDWYHDGIHFCVEEGIMNGMGEGVFAPNEPTTRAQLVTMLYRLEGEPTIEGKTEPFADVAETDWFYAPIVWAYNNKVVNGVSDTEFAPNANVTREQVATILYRFLESPEGTGKLDAFPDVTKVSGYAVDALTWAVGAKLITGVAQPDGTTVLDPAGNATRAQIATILMRHLTA